MLGNYARRNHHHDFALTRHQAERMLDWIQAFRECGHDDYDDYLELRTDVQLERRLLKFIGCNDGVDQRHPGEAAAVIGARERYRHHYQRNTPADLWTALERRLAGENK